MSAFGPFPEPEACNSFGELLTFHTFLPLRQEEIEQEHDKLFSLKKNNF